MTPPRHPHALTRFHVVLTVARGLVAVPVGFFGLLIFFSVFGDGSRIVGGLLMLAAVSGPAVHGTIAWTSRRARPQASRIALHATLGLWLVDALASGVFLAAAFSGAGALYAGPFALVALIHGTGLYLARGGRPRPAQTQRASG